MSDRGDATSDPVQPLDATSRNERGSLDGPPSVGDSARTETQPAKDTQPTKDGEPAKETQQTKDGEPAKETQPTKDGEPAKANQPANQAAGVPEAPNAPVEEAAAKSGDPKTLPPSDIHKIQSGQVEEKDRDLESRFREGTCTPGEAMYFWNKYMPIKTDTPPVWNEGARMWVISGAAPGGGSGGGPGGAGAGGAPGGGSSAGSGGGPPAGGSGGGNGTDGAGQGPGDSGGGLPSPAGGEPVQGGLAGGTDHGAGGADAGGGDAGFGHNLGILLKVLGGLLEFEAKRTFDVGEARKGFIVGVTGLPLEPPTDPYGRAEWERGERVAGILAIIDMLVGSRRLPPGLGGGPRGMGFAPALAPAGAGGGPGPGGGHLEARPARPPVAAGQPATGGGARGGRAPDQKTPEQKTPEQDTGRKAPEPSGLPRGTSRNEAAEPKSLEKHSPGAVPGVKSQPALDWVRKPQVHITTTDENGVRDRVTGGEWWQNKRLEPTLEPGKEPGEWGGTKATVEKRIADQVKLAVDKFQDPVTRGESSRSWTGPDGVKHTMVATNPEKLVINIEVPGFDRMSPEQQAGLQRYAEGQLDAWREADGKLWGLPAEVRVTSPP